VNQKTYHGEIDPQELADVLVNRFDQGDLTARKVGQPDRVVVQISSRAHRHPGDPHTSLSVTIAEAEDGVTVTVGEQQVLGVAADLVQTGIGALLNPMSLIGEIDDIVRDVSKLTLPQQVWEVVEAYCRSVGAGLGLAPDKVLVTCPFCGVGNPIGVGKCPHCGGSLAEVQPVTCPQCGQILEHDAKFCTRCGMRVAQ
jgi:hypothetical protein